MTAYGPHHLAAAVAAICPDVQARIGQQAARPEERHLWWELSACVLSSQVPYSLAIAAADAIDEGQLLLTRDNDTDRLTQRLTKVLSAPLLIEGRKRMYRFPVARARHLAATRAVVNKKACSLQALLESFEDAALARAWFVRHAPGLGPKQASMFLRNAGVSYDLAVLDRHVLKYMSHLGIYERPAISIAGLAEYRQHEDTLRGHADAMNCPVGILDWAIWIVMRVARRETEKLSV
ncbi:hypothetical protein PO002_41400 [Cupriavidus necator]|uniref:8-oxoguanine DNA glycosylase n=1 Tax=Cupriavidus necator TaxID=106590 RepID=UPI0039C3E3D5